MQRQTGIALVLILIGIAVVAGYRYYDFSVARNYHINAHVPCDPASELCFAADCAPDDASCDATPYAKVQILAHEAPHCIEDNSCESFSCDGYSSCTKTDCTADTLEDGEICEVASEPEPAPAEATTTEAL